MTLKITPLLPYLLSLLGVSIERDVDSFYSRFELRVAGDLRLERASWIWSRVLMVELVIVESIYDMRLCESSLLKCDIT